MKKILVLLLCCASSVFLKAQNYYLEGVVTDLFGKPVNKAGVFVKNSSFFAFTNDSGYYKMLLPQGTFTIYAEHKDFLTYSSSLTIQGGDKVLDIFLESVKTNEVQRVTIQTKRVDYANEIMEALVKNKDRYTAPKPFTTFAYIKASTQLQQQIDDTLQQKKIKDTAQNGLAQVYLKINVSENLAIKEERLGVKIQGNKQDLYWLSATEGFNQVYDNFYTFYKVCEVPIVSPVSKLGLISYRFETEKIWFENGDKIYKIGFKPMSLGNALGEGYLIIKDTAFQVIKIAMFLPRMHLPVYNRFAFSQNYSYPSDSLASLQSQEFLYNLKAGKSIYYGKTEVKFDSNQYNQKFDKKFFGNMLSSTQKEAYEKDSMFWDKVRSAELTPDELLFERKQDSVKAVMESMQYKDSMQRDFNKVDLKKLFLLGQGNYNHKKERLFQFQPLLFAYQPVMVAGARIAPWASYRKQYEDKKFVQSYLNLTYGLRNNDLKGGVFVRYLFDPIKRRQVSLNLQQNFEFINSNDAWVNLFRRSNFFERKSVSGYYTQEVFNGLFATVGGSFSDRKSIENYDFNPFGDSLFLAFGDSARNQPRVFQPYKALDMQVSLSYTPQQKYMMEPYQKIILGSKWPTFSAFYKKGLPNTLGSTVDYDYLGFDIEQRLKLGLLGRMNYRVNTGKFLQRQDLRLVDYVFQPNSNPYLFSNPNYTFQRLDTVYNTFNWFLEGHLLHRFNGAILNKIPLLRKAQMVEAVGGGFLLSPENNLRYFEVYAGIEKLVKILEERFRLGVYVVGAQSNQFEAPIRLKFSIEYFNRQDNEWMF